MLVVEVRDVKTLSVILSAVDVSRSEASTESKDPGDAGATGNVERHSRDVANDLERPP
jgi:hypothetical protein